MQLRLESQTTTLMYMRMLHPLHRVPIRQQRYQELVCAIKQLMLETKVLLLQDERMDIRTF